MIQKPRRMWMGPRGGETWVPVEQVGGDRSRSGWQSTTGYISGGTGVRQSVSSHMTYTMTWNRTSREALRPITDMRAGIRGPGPIYFIDPMASDENVLSECWSFPAQACYDAIPLFEDSRPEKVQTSGTTLGYPPESAKYDLTSGTSRSIYVPIPPGYAAHVGVHGSTNGAGGVRVRKTSGISGYAGAVFPNFLSVTDDTRVNTVIDGVDGIEVDIAPDKAGGVYPGGDTYPSSTLTPQDATDPATQIVLSGLIVQILPIGVTPTTGGFISGQGHSGCVFDGNPTVTSYSAVLDNVAEGMSAKFIEIGDWV